MTVGVLLIAAAVALSAYNYYEEKRAADAADNVMSLLHQAIGSPPTSNELETNPPELPFEETDSDKMTVMEIDGYGYIGYLSIPALDLELSGDVWNGLLSSENCSMPILRFSQNRQYGHCGT